MPKYRRPKVKVTGEKLGEPEFWVEIHDIRGWPTSRLERLQELATQGDSDADLPSGAEVNQFESAQGFFAELVHAWNLVSTEDESDDPPVLPIPSLSEDSIKKIPVGFLLLISERMAELMEEMAVPLANEGSS